MQRYVDFLPYLTYVATLTTLWNMNYRKKINEIHRVPKNQADTFVTKLWLIGIL